MVLDWQPPGVRSFGWLKAGTLPVILDASQMPDFGIRWINPQKLEKGGQAQTYTVEDAENPGVQRVAKILDDPKEDRKARFLQEIEVTESFKHPHVVQSVDKDETKNNKWPFFVCRTTSS